jgi:AAA domain-containing protein
MIPAPPWLTELIRPKTPERDRSLYADYTGRDGHAYALTAVRGELAKMSAAPPGQRNDTAFAVSCRLVELAMADWARLDYQEVQAAYLAACEVANVDGMFQDGEAWKCWFHAERKIGEPATLPVAEHLGTRVDWIDPIPFAEAGQVPGTTDRDSILDQFETAVRTEMWRAAAREEATRRLRTLRDANITDLDSETLDDAGLAELPGGVMLVDGYLEADSLARVNGPSGHGKSFVVLDLGACVANGRMWHGRAVEKAGVVYAIGEGQRGMGKRAAAWCQRHELSSTGISWIPRALQVDGPEWLSFVTYCSQRAPGGLIILDTQARMTVGMKENDATEMGIVVAALDELRAVTGACVLLVHHRGLTGDHGRGSTAIRGALTSELDVSKTGTNLTIKVTKQKDGAEVAPLTLTMNPLGESLVLVGDRDNAIGSPFVSPASSLSAQERAAIAIAHALMQAPGAGLSRADACAHARVAMELPAGDRTKKQLQRGWDLLIELGRIAKADGRMAHFWIEIEGAELLALNPGKLVVGGPERYVPEQ